MSYSRKIAIATRLENLLRGVDNEEVKIIYEVLREYHKSNVIPSLDSKIKVFSNFNGHHKCSITKNNTELFSSIKGKWISTFRLKYKAIIEIHKLINDGKIEVNDLPITPLLPPVYTQEIHRDRVKAVTHYIGFLLVMYTKELQDDYSNYRSKFKLKPKIASSIDEREAPRFNFLNLK